MQRTVLIEKLAHKVKKEGFKPSVDKTISFEKMNRLEKYSKNKQIPKEYEKHVLKALSYYPELESEKISFIVTSTIFSMETQIKPITIFKRKKHYVIKIKKRTADIYFNKFAPETVIALLCHELGHVVDYSKKNSLGLIKFAVLYIFPKSRQKIEFETEIRSLFHGTGHFMTKYYDEFTANLDFLVKRKRLKKYTLNYHHKNYLTKNEMIKLMEVHK